MPLSSGLSIHDDTKHKGSAKRDTANGLAALDGAGSLLSKGEAIYFTRNPFDEFRMKERTSNETFLAGKRLGVDDYEALVHVGGVYKYLQHSGMKDIVNGIAGLDASAKLSNGLYAGIKKEYTLSGDVLHSHDVAVNTLSTTYVKLKTITLDTLFKTPSTIRISFNLWTSESAETAYGRIYKNGGAVGTERSRTGAGSETFEEDISFAQGDTLELYLKTSNASHNANANNFRVLGSETQFLLADAIVAGSVGLDNPFVATNS